jgi:hypothetical protein
MPRDKNPTPFRGVLYTQIYALFDESDGWDHKKGEVTHFGPHDRVVLRIRL